MSSNNTGSGHRQAGGAGQNTKNLDWVPSQLGIQTKAVAKDRVANDQAGPIAPFIAEGGLSCP